MASTLPPYTWKTGYRLPAETAAWADKAHHLTKDGEKSHYQVPVDDEPLTSTANNTLGACTLRTWPTIYDGTASPMGPPSWFKPQKEVDVLICGGGPFGLKVGVSIARQGLSFRIVDKAAAPLIAGRADGIQPRGLEYLHSWGLVEEVTEEGPILNTTTLYKDGNRLFHGSSTQCDSRYKGVHIITQGQMEKIYIRDLLRHKVIVERSTIVDSFQVENDSTITYPITANLKNTQTGQTEVVRAKHLVGADGAGSSIRMQLAIPFDGVTTDIYWGIMDARFKTDWPHLGFNIIISAEHGGVIVIPREDGYTRFYTQLNGDKARRLAQNRQARRNASAVGETKIDDHGIAPEEVLEQLNKILAPHTVEFASALSWFSVWKVSERVARTFSTPDLRVHIGGDAAHVHSVLGAFGLNSSIFDAANLGWKLGYSIKQYANPQILLPTYDKERRLFANRVIRCSGAYLRFICNAKNVPLAELRGLGEELEVHDEQLPTLDGTKDGDQQFLGAFFRRNAHFLLGVETPAVESPLCALSAYSGENTKPTTVDHGARAPNPRVCLGQARTAYLYDVMMGPPRFHILLFASDMQGPIRTRLDRFASQMYGPQGFFTRFNGKELFNCVLVVKAVPHEIEELWSIDGLDDLSSFHEHATIIFDDRPPDEDAHYWYGINHARGAAVVVRPDLWVGTSAWLDEPKRIDEYFTSFLLPTALPNASLNFEQNPTETHLTGWRKRVQDQLDLLGQILHEAEEDQSLMGSASDDTAETSSSHSVTTESDLAEIDRLQVSDEKIVGQVAVQVFPVNTMVDNM